MALLPNFPISGDDYTVGTITTVAGSKDFTTKDAYLQSYGAVQAGDHIYIASAGKFLIIASITGENSGTLTDPCPTDCAVTDADLRIIFKTASSRLQGRTAMLLERLSKGCLASLAELSPKEGQFFRATGVEGQLENVDLSAGMVTETDDRKYMTAGERDKLAGINGLEQPIWNAGKSTTEALVSPAKFFAVIAAMGAWRGGQKFGTDTAGGYILPNGLIFQFGLVQRQAADFNMAFPMVFPNACMFATGVSAFNYGAAGGGIFIGISISNLTHAAVDFRVRYITNGGTVISKNDSFPVYWIAFGY
ncbi:gp53-like domain-containing protein [Bartonella apis]|uniref:gp53-like domain-containing protein n=1 Tax=Bartonella apis TaxID=1686310 RepID=UPI002430447F|nr:hypothetical protein [Bartonella apis]MCT6825235.1 hypothetical protein [Bartonella apis]MCT6860950.1 hypothetical protein [Bartonella apis]